MCLVALEDPGLAVFPTHRLVRGLDGRRRAALSEAIERDFFAESAPRDAPAPPAGDGPLELGYLDRDRSLRLVLRDRAIAERALGDRLVAKHEPQRAVPVEVAEFERPIARRRCRRVARRALREEVALDRLAERRAPASVEAANEPVGREHREPGVLERHQAC